MRAWFTRLAFLATLAGLASAEPARITVEAGQAGTPISPLLWGIFFEDINLSADGGIYAELVRNRSFEDAEKPEYWNATGPADIAVDNSQPASAKNPHSLRIDATGPGGGAVNGGYWGMALQKGESYKLSFFARGESALSVSLENADGSVVYAKGSCPAPGKTWTTCRVELEASATDPRARLVLRTKDAGTVWIDMVSLFPAKTWKGHGLRPDLCEMLAGLKPAFVRFPGGCWVEGDTMATSYRWKKTIGDPAEREPLWNIWGYNATHGLGYHEYLQLCEDLGAEPLFCINVGMSHKETVPMDKMDEYVQDALDAIEYANGPVTSTWGALRAKAGHPAPFGLKLMEIGNENGGPKYHERWPLFYNAIKAKCPEVKLIANVWTGYPKTPPPDLVDEHYYNDPGFFIREAGKYDAYDRKGPKIFVGEYAVTRDCGQGNLAGAIGEAAFMTGLERNGDIVAMASYAPLFVNMNHRRWNPDLINYDSSRVFGLPSYYVQQLFAQNRGDAALPVEIVAPPAPAATPHGAIGVGTWLTQAEFKDIRVTKGDQVLFASDFSKGTAGWRTHGGKWSAKDGVLRQSSDEDNVRAFFGDKNWSDYTLTLKARKIGGQEGFLIAFGVRNEGGKSWWNIGGWGNSRHGLEVGGLPEATANGKIETGRWYDIRVELQGSHARCYLDGQLVHDVEATGSKSLHASALRAKDEVVVKVVNVADVAQEADLDVRGAASVAKRASVTVLTSVSPDDENSLDQPTRVAPVVTEIESAGAAFRHNFPAHSLTVLRLRAPKG